MHMIDHGVTRFKTFQVRKKRRASAISDHFEPKINASQFIRLFARLFGQEAILAWFHNLWNHINMSFRLSVQVGGHFVKKTEFIRLFLNKVDFGFSVRFGNSRERISQLVRCFLMNFDWHVPLIFIYNFCSKAGSNLCEEGPQKIQFLKRVKLNFSAEPCVLPTKKFISLS